jgi:hypothetical protein
MGVARYPIYPIYPKRALAEVDIRVGLRRCAHRMTGSP